MLSQKLYKTITAYLEGKLSGTELSDFEAKLQANPDLAKEVSFLKEIDVAVSDQSVLQFQELVRKEGETFKQEQNPKAAPVKKLRPSRFYLGIAASLLFLIGSVFLFWKYSATTPLSGQELFAQHFETYDLDQSMRGEAATTNVLFQTAIQQYQAKDFSAASNSFQQLVTDDPKDMVLSFCLANAYLNQATPSLDLAATQLRKIIADGESIYVLRSKWYLAMIFLEQEELAAAKKLLQELTPSPDHLGKKANDLLKELAN